MIAIGRCELIKRLSEQEVMQLNGEEGGGGELLRRVSIGLSVRTSTGCGGGCWMWPKIVETLQVRQAFIKVGDNLQQPPPNIPGTSSPLHNRHPRALAS